MQQFGIGRNSQRLVADAALEADWRLMLAQRRLVERRDFPQYIGHIYIFELRLRHLGKIAEAANDVLQIRNLDAKRLGALAKDFVEVGARHSREP